MRRRHSWSAALRDMDSILKKVHKPACPPRRFPSCGDRTAPLALGHYWNPKGRAAHMGSMNCAKGRGLHAC